MNDPELTAEAVRALNEGRIVEYRNEGDSWIPGVTWEGFSSILRLQRVNSSHVRIAPAPKFVPWGINDEIIGRVVRRKGFTERMLITCQTEVGFIVSVGFFPYSEGFEKLEQHDGSCCGKAVQS